MKTIVLIAALLISMNAFADGSIGLDDAIDQLTNGVKNDDCFGDLKAQPALAQALKALDLEHSGDAGRIGNWNEKCGGARTMPYWFKSKDGTVKVMIFPEIILVQQTTADDEKYSMPFDWNITPSLASVSLGPVLKKKALKEIANGRKEERFCTKATQGYPSLAKAVEKLNLSDTGTGVLITRNSVIGALESYCVGLTFMPYAFKTKNGKLTVEIQNGTAAISPTDLRSN